MSTILYYSNFCQHSKSLLQTFGKSPLSKNVHFICIDKRVKDPSGKTHIVLENGQKIILPENVTKVPALLLLNDNYRVLYGESILQHFKPMQEVTIKQATFNNIEPMAFSFGGGGGGSASGFGAVVSDQYSFLDMNDEDLSAKGNGGMRQMHNYVDLNYSDKISTPTDDVNYKGSNKLPQDLTIEQLQQQRENELGKGGRGPY
jgi:hypothetical protein